MDRPGLWEWREVVLVVCLVVTVAALLWVVYEGVDRFWDDSRDAGGWTGRGRTMLS